MYARLIFIFWLSLFAQEQSEEVSLDIKGTWRLLHIMGGWGPTVAKKPVITLKLADSTYRRYKNGKLVKKGHYSVKKEHYYGLDQFALTYDDDLRTKCAVRLEQGRMVENFGPGVAGDGLTAVYDMLK